jgi:hypothetical protein
MIFDMSDTFYCYGGTAINLDPRRFIALLRRRPATRLIAGSIVNHKVLLSTAWYDTSSIWDEPTVDEILVDSTLYERATFVLHVLDDQKYLHTVHVTRDVYKYLRDNRVTRYDQQLHAGRTFKYYY